MEALSPWLDKIICGDCLDVMREMPENSVDAVVTDPPYGIDYQSCRRTQKEKRLPKIQNDERPFIWWLYDAFRLVKSDGAIVCFCRWDVQEAFKLAVEWAGFKIRSQVIWDREHHGMGDLKSSFAPRHDIIWFGTKGDFEFQSTRPQSIIKSKRLGSEELCHPNQKPVNIMEQLIIPTTPKGGVILDPFLGSGTTAIAAKNLGRFFIGIEKSEEYCAIANRRVEEALRQPRLFCAN